MRNERTNGRLRRRAESGLAVLSLAALPFLAAGCDEDYVFVHDCPPPSAPVGVYSVTGDGEVTVYWTAVAEEYVDEFVVYRAPTPRGTYREIGHTGRDWFVDRGAANGVTYFYAITSVDECGYESDLSREIAQDTPRPEGYGTLLDANGPDWRRSGWDLSAERAVAWDAPSADFWFIVEDGVPFLVAADVDTDIQDAGFLDFDDLDWAPDGGWNPSGAVEAVRGHCYVVWTRDNHFAKVRLRGVDRDRADFDWAYQIDGGNPELKPRLRQDGSSAGLLGTGESAR